MSKIDNDVPLPDNYGPHRKKHLASDLEVGQSYFVEASGEAVNYSIKKEQRRTTKKFTRKAVTEGGVTGYRVWRVA